MVTFVTGHESPEKGESAIDWELLARNPGTLVFLMGVKNLPEISASLMAHGKPAKTPAALVRWGTTSKQVTIVSTLEDIPGEAKKRGITAPAVLVVGSVSTLHDRLGWFERKPLFGKRILVTRSRAQSGRMAQKISEYGGDPIPFPTISIEKPEDMSPLDDCIRRISAFDWIIFTSVNGVEHFFERFFQLQADIRDMAGPRIGAIGPVTAAAIRKRGIKVDLLAKEYVAEGVLAQLAPDEIHGRRFLIPRAEKARHVLPEGIVQMGGHVEVIPVYRTVLPPDSDIDEMRTMLKNKEVDAVTFTSSSTVDHFVRMLDSNDLQNLLHGVVIASIGPVTSDTIKKHGLWVDAEAREYTIDGLVTALVDHVCRNKK
jgi:uroporphyrinogen III methyltransferase/synthase